MEQSSVGAGNRSRREPDSADLTKDAFFVPLITRRCFLKSSIGAVVACAIPGCVDSPTEEARSGTRLAARPGNPTITPTVGLSPLGLGQERDGVLLVPEGYSADTPAPLFVALHGAGGEARNWSNYYIQAESRGMILLAPDSRAATWDLIRGGFGPDVVFLDQALRHTFARCRIDPERIALGGLSDGATYALSLGVSNGDLFSHLVAYSPGFMTVSGQTVGKPKVFVSHGTDDTVLPVTISRDVIVPALRDSGYDVTYEEFVGGHELPSGVTNLSLDWFV